ncbi:MAG: transglycosylase SLT domain-containing protein [Bdellovibrionales bacterium]|nr:transglycosylase SLT domain-containing protein [Bdellovibrionales bacterium]
MKCRPGYHYVKSHTRTSSNGQKYKVEAHCRVNANSKKDHLYKSNLEYLYNNMKKNYKYKTLKRVKGFNQDRGQYDEMIQFWLKYWRQKGLIREDIDPLLVKSIIAIESSFREKVITSLPNSSATGLMQIVKKTMRILSGKLGNEVRKVKIDISQQDAKIANVNIAAGTRWLIYKITTSPWRNKKNKQERLFAGVKYYHSWDQAGEDYARKVFDLYEKSKK